MSLHIISYSLKGNNVKLATFLARELKCNHTILQEKKPRSIGKCVMDFIFHITPHPINIPLLAKEDEVMFVGPIWAGNPCSIFRRMFREVKTSNRIYDYVSISGGNLAQNHDVLDKLINMTGKKPRYISVFALTEVAQRQIAQKDVMKIVLDDEHIEKLAKMIAEEYLALK